MGFELFQEIFRFCHNLTEVSNIIQRPILKINENYENFRERWKYELNMV